MARKRYTTEEIIRKLREADVLIGQGQTVADVIRHLGVSDVTATLAGPRLLSRCASPPP